MDEARKKLIEDISYCYEQYVRVNDWLNEEPELRAEIRADIKKVLKQHNETLCR